MSTLRVNTVTDSAGSGNPDVGIDTSGIAKAWVNFNGTGTVAIRKSFNVSSITDNGTGNYTVNFTTPMADANYLPVYYMEGGFDVQRYQSSGTQLAGSCGLRSGYQAGTSLVQADIGILGVAIFS